MERSAFERLVLEAIDALPTEFLRRLDNVEIVVEDWPDAVTLQRAGVSHPANLLGFYTGVPQTRRTRQYTLVLPDKINIYRRPIEMRAHTMSEIKSLIARVLRHEIAHHFGISDSRLLELDAY